jgi:predicted HNH restriction endonuclease
VKEGVRIVGKGTLESGYYFDETNGMVDENEIPWPHQVKVFWQRDFSPVEIVLGADQHTVLKLSDDDAALIERQAETVSAEADRLTALEGESFSAESDFRSRNRALVAAKKHLFDFHCEICGFSFEEKYGEIGEDFIIAHHLRPISSGPTVTTLDDIALVCSNCHSMVHMRNPPYLVQEMKTILNGLQQ